MAEFEGISEAVIDVTRPAFEGIEDLPAKEVGDLGERLARTYLADNGYGIVDVNWKTPFGEADIIAQTDDETIFVEVKSRRLLECSAEDECRHPPEEAFDACKFERYAKISELYKIMHEEAAAVRFDVVAITFLSNRIAHIRHLMGAYWWDD